MHNTQNYTNNNENTTHGEYSTNTINNYYNKCNHN
jgi:hypothetical protein